MGSMTDPTSVPVYRQPAHDPLPGDRLRRTYRRGEYTDLVVTEFTAGLVYYRVENHYPGCAHVFQYLGHVDLIAWRQIATRGYSVVERAGEPEQEKP